MSDTTTRLSNLIVWDLYAGPYLQRTSGVCGYAMCVRDTRIPVWALVSCQRAGLSDAAILGAYPGLAAGDLEAAWGYAGKHGEEMDREIRENQE